MALNGSFTNYFQGARSRFYIIVDWSATQNIANNTSTIIAKAYVKPDGAITANATKSGSITIAGNKEDFTFVLGSVGAGVKKYVGEHTVVVSHNTVGDLTASIASSLKIDITYSDKTLGTISTSGNAVLNNIPRATKPSISPTSQAVGSDVTISLPTATSTFTHDLAYRIGNGIWKNIATGATTSYKWTLPSSLIDDIGSNTSVVVAVRAITKSGNSTIGSEQVDLVTATLPNTATLTSAPNFNDDSNPTINYSNPGGNLVSSLRVGIYMTNGTSALAPYRDVGKTSSSYTFNLSEAERNSIRNQMLDKNSMVVRFYIQTTYGSNVRTHILERTVSIVNATPVFSGVTYKDTNTTTTALTGSNQTIVNGQSNIQLTNFDTSVFKNATRKSVIIDGTSYTWVTDFNRTLNKYAKNNIPLQVVDSRGNASNIYSKEFSNFINYSNVSSGAPSAKRSNNGVGESVTLVLSGTAWNGNFGTVTNNLTATYRYKVTGTSSWSNGISNLVLSRNGNNFTINQGISGDISGGFNIANSYDLEITIKDRLSTKIATTIILGGEPAIAFFKNNVSIGGQYDESRSNQPIQLNKSAFDKNGVEIIGNAIIDTRDDNRPPSWYVDNYPRLIVREMKLTKSVGLPQGIIGGIGFCEVETRVRWGGNYLHDVTQTAYCDNNRQFVRVGKSTSWTEWMAIVKGVLS